MSVSDRLRALDAMTVAKQIAWIRVALGVVALAAPGVLRPFARDGRVSEDTALFVRLFGGRDIAMGAGLLLAERRGPQAVRGWAEAGALVDGIDVGIMVGSKGFRPVFRLLAATSASGAAALGVSTARRLTRG